MNAQSLPNPLRLRMQVGTKERVHKVFIIHGSSDPKARAPVVDFRILTKEKQDGVIELLGYAYWFDGVDEHQGSVLRAPAVPPEHLTALVRRVVEQTGTDIHQMEVLDLTTNSSRLDQADRLAQHDLLEAFDFQ